MMSNQQLLKSQTAMKDVSLGGGWVRQTSTNPCALREMMFTSSKNPILLKTISPKCSTLCSGRLLMSYGVASSEELCNKIMMTKQEMERMVYGTSSMLLRTRNLAYGSWCWTDRFSFHGPDDDDDKDDTHQLQLYESSTGCLNLNRLEELVDVVN